MALAQPLVRALAQQMLGEHIQRSLGQGSPIAEMIFLPRANAVAKALADCGFEAAMVHKKLAITVPGEATMTVDVIGLQLGEDIITTGPGHTWINAQDWILGKMGKAGAQCIWFDPPERTGLSAMLPSSAFVGSGELDKIYRKCKATIEQAILDENDRRAHLPTWCAALLGQRSAASGVLSSYGSNSRLSILCKSLQCCGWQVHLVMRKVVLGKEGDSCHEENIMAIRSERGEVVGEKGILGWDGLANAWAEKVKNDYWLDAGTPWCLGPESKVIQDPPANIVEKMVVIVEYADLESRSCPSEAQAGRPARRL